MLKQKIILPLVAILILAGIIYIGMSNVPKQESPAIDNNAQAPLVEGFDEADLPEDLGVPELAGEPALPEEEGSDDEPPLGEALIGIEEPISDEPEIPAWLSPDEPMQSLSLEQGEAPKDAIKISMTASGISPLPFEVKRGAKITLVISSTDNITHVFKFKDPSLSEVVVGLSRGQTRAITFYAPDKKGEYEIYCNVPGHEARGETGIMIVK